MSKNFYQNRVFGDFGLIEILLRGCKRVEVEAKVFSFNTLITLHTFRFGFAKIQTFEISLYRFVPFCAFLYPFVSFLFVIGLGSTIASQTKGYREYRRALSFES